VKKLRIAFAGSSSFAVPALTALAATGQVVLVVTQPDRPAGRGLKPKAPPVKEAALALGLPLIQPASINAPETLEELKKLSLDLLAVAAYGQLLKKPVLSLPKLGCVNVHASLLPKYRGAAPIAWAILNGERVTGVTTFLMDEGMDTGPILLQREVEIGPDETRGELEARLAKLGAELLLETVEGLAKGTIRPRPQPREGTLAPRLHKEDGRIDWSWPAERVHNWVRGMSPWPSAFTSFRGRLLKIHRSHLSDFPHPGLPPGTVLPLREALFVACGDGVVELLEIQPEGKRRMSGVDFINGYQPLGERLI